MKVKEGRMKIVGCSDGMDVWWWERVSELRIVNNGIDGVNGRGKMMDCSEVRRVMMIETEMREGKWQ